MSTVFSLVSDLRFAASGSAVDLPSLNSNVTRRSLETVERAGFGNVIIDDAAGLLSNFDLALQAARASRSMTVFVTHWAGVMEPATAARSLIELSERCHGRLGLRILPACGDSADETKLSHAESWRLTDEYLEVLGFIWSQGSEKASLDFSGSGRATNRIPIRLAGQSGTALHVAGRHADIFELSPGTRYELGVMINRVKSAAAHYGREELIKFALPIRLTHNNSSAHRPSLPALMEKVEPYVDLGIDEFMVVGADSLGVISSFTHDTARILQHPTSATAQPGRAN